MANTGALGTPGATQSTPGPTSAPPNLNSMISSLVGAIGSGNAGTSVGGATAGAASSSYAGYLLSGLLGEQGMAGGAAQAGVSAAELGAGTSYDLSNALLNYQGLGLQEQGLATQMGTSAKQQGIEEAGYGVQQGQYPEQMQQAALQNALAVSGLQRQGAISGTTLTTGHKEQQAAQGAEYGWQQADIFRNQQLAQLAQQSEEAGYGGQQAGFANQRQQLELAAKSQGLNAQQAYSQLGFGLNQLGISSSPEQYLSSIQQAEGGAAQTMQAALSQAALYGGLPAGFGQ